MNEIVELIKVVKGVLNYPSVARDLATLQNLLYNCHNVHKKFKFYRTFKQIQSLMKKFSVLKLRETIDKELE